jgi:hypothetical protein
VNRNGDADFLNHLVANGSTEDISNQFERWAAKEPDLTSGWLAKHADSSPFRAAAIKGMVRYLEKTDPEAAAAWRKEIPQ